MKRQKPVVVELGGRLPALERIESYLRQINQRAIRRELRGPRYQDPRRLFAYGFQAYSQGEEDGILLEIFRRIGTTSKTFIEFGVGDGRVCNTILPLIMGWSGTWLESSTPHAMLAAERFKDFPLTVRNEVVRAENANRLITGDPDLLSLDVDGNDYWIWKAIVDCRPRVVVIEYNALFPPPIRKTIAYDPAFVWGANNYFGASLSALEALGREKGYSLVGCSAAGVNAFFVRDDLIESGEGSCCFAEPFTAENHYEPARYALSEWGGYPPAVGKWEDV